MPGFTKISEDFQILEVHPKRSPILVYGVSTQFLKKGLCPKNILKNFIVLTIDFFFNCNISSEKITSFVPVLSFNIPKKPSLWIIIF